MRRHSLFKYLAFWTGGKGRSSADRGPRAAIRSQPLVRFTSEQLDQLHEILAPGRDDANRSQAPAWDDREAGAPERQARFLRAVDRAISEIATSRRRDKGFLPLARLTANPRPPEGDGDRRGRSRTGPRRRPA